MQRKDVKDDDASAFAVGMVITMSGRVPWWRRLWRWITRYKAPVLQVQEVDRAHGVITFGQVQDLPVAVAKIRKDKRK